MTENVRKILIVDDERYNINILVEILKSEYRTLVAKSGKGALKRVLSDQPPDLILLDIMMPEMDGYEVCQRLKENPQTRNIPIIFITAMSEIEDEARGLKLGAIDYITKPVSPSIVRARIKNHLALKVAREKIDIQKQQLEEQNKALIETAHLRENVERLTRHDLKTPLNAIIGFSQLLSMDNNLTETQQDCIRTIEESGYRMLNIINLSVDLLKMERGVYRFKPVAVNLLKVIGKITAEVGDLAKAKRLTLDIRADGQPASEADEFVVRAEELLCYTMLANLIRNAMEASPRGERIGVDLAHEDGAIIRIHNKGAVPENIRERFFDIYVTSGKRKGSGLGTYSAKLMAETQKGSIRMDTSETEGTTLTIRLPG